MVEFLLDIQEIRRPESMYKLTANWWSSIKDLKDKIFSITREPPSRQHIFHSTNPVELHNNQILHDLGIESSGRMLRVAIDYRTRLKFTLTPTKGVLIDESCREMLHKVRLGLQRNIKPKSTDEFEGSGGVYFLRSPSGSYEAVFKPHDEEQGMPANPKDHVGAGKEGLREHFLPGQGCLRELAAYIMDHQNFCRVPATTLVHCEHESFHYPVVGSNALEARGRGDPYPKLGGLQRFIHGAELFEDLGPSLLNDLEVQKIALLDMRILNCDRNAANILVKHTPVMNNDHYHDDSDSNEITFMASSESDRSRSPSPEQLILNSSSSHTSPSSVYELYPIDHGYAMPSRLKIFEWDWAWLHYPHINRPVAPEVVKYMESLDIDDLLHKLEPQVPLSEDSIFLLRLSHYLVLHGIRAGLTLKEIAMVIARSDEDVASKLELSVEEAEENAYRSIELKSMSRVKGSSSMLSQLSTSVANSTNSSPRSTVDVTPLKSSKESVPEFPLAISLDLLRGKEENLPITSVACSGSGSGNDDHTTNETDSSSAYSDRLSPPTTYESSHAINHSPMRPHLSSSSSWNSFASFVSPQPSLHSYVKMRGPAQDNSLGMSPRVTKKSKYLPPGPLNSVDKIVVPANVSNVISVCEQRKLDTIIEYARDRGLSSLSNCSTNSHGSECEIAEGWQSTGVTTNSIPSPATGSVPAKTTLPSIASCDSTDEVRDISLFDVDCEVLHTSSSQESLPGIHLGLHASSSCDSEEKHRQSLPNNALRRMNAITGSITQQVKEGGETVDNNSKKWRPSYNYSNQSHTTEDSTTTSTTTSSDYDSSDLQGVGVDFSIPTLIRHQRSIDSSLEPVVYGRGMRTWAPENGTNSSNGGGQMTPKLTKAALSGNSLSSFLGQPPMHVRSSSVCSSSAGSGNGETVGDFGSGDYGFFNTMKEDFSTTLTSTTDDSLPINYGEFSGIDLPNGQGGTSSSIDDFDELCAPVPLTRVVSFSGFESAPVYNNIFAGTMGNLRLERRKGIAKSKEFMQLRLQFAQEHIMTTISRMRREKEKCKETL